MSLMAARFESLMVLINAEVIISASIGWCRYIMGQLWHAAMRAWSFNSGADSQISGIHQSAAGLSLIAPPPPPQKDNGQSPTTIRQKSSRKTISWF